MKCGKCGHAYGVTGYGRDKKYAYYNCITYSKRGKDVCAGHSVRADELDKEVIEKVKSLIFSDANMQKLVNDINAATKSLRIDYGKKITELKNKTNEMQLRITRQYEAIETGAIDLNLVSSRLKELNAQKNALQEEISYYESLNSQNQPVYITRTMIEKFRREMEQIFMGNNVQEQREFLKKFIEKIIVKEEKIEIIYCAPGAKFPSLIHPSA